MMQQVLVKDPKTGAFMVTYVDRGTGHAIPATQKRRGATGVSGVGVRAGTVFRAEKVA